MHTGSSRYSVIIRWSDEDDAFLVSLPEWQDRLIGYAGHGSTYEEALAAARITLEHLISIALERGESLPVAETATLDALAS